MLARVGVVVGVVEGRLAVGQGAIVLVGVQQVVIFVAVRIVADVLDFVIVNEFLVAEGDLLIKNFHFLRIRRFVIIIQQFLPFLLAEAADFIKQRLKMLLRQITCSSNRR